MADGRFISRSIAHNEELGGVSLLADFLFGRCIPHLDVEGRMAGNPQLVKSITCPLRSEISAGEVPALLGQLADAGLVRWYEAEGKQVLAFPGFERQQKGLRKDREAPSKLPAPHTAGAVRLRWEPDMGVVRSDSGPTPEPSGAGPAQVEVEVEVEVQAEVEETASNDARESPEVVEAAKAEMRADAVEHAKTIPPGNDRKHFNAEVRGIVSGDRSAAWKDGRTGLPVPWSLRPARLRLAFDALTKGDADSLHWALVFAHTQEDDPLRFRTAEEIQQARAEAAGPTTTDALRSTEAAGLERRSAEEEAEAIRRAEEEERIAAWEAADEIRAQRLRQTCRDEAAELPGGHLPTLAEGIAKANYRRQVLELLSGKADPHAA